MSHIEVQNNYAKHCCDHYMKLIKDDAQHAQANRINEYYDNHKNRWFGLFKDKKFTYEELKADFKFDKFDKFDRYRNIFVDDWVEAMYRFTYHDYRYDRIKELMKLINNNHDSPIFPIYITTDHSFIFNKTLEG